MIGGALLAGASIMLPWYDAELFGVKESVSGIDAREQASFALIILAAVACGGFNVRREVPVVAAAAVVAIVVGCLVAVPDVPQPEDSLGGYTLSIGFSRAWGLWVALAGAVAMLAGAARAARAYAM